MVNSFKSYFDFLKNLKLLLKIFANFTNLFHSSWYKLLVFNIFKKGFYFISWAPHCLFMVYNAFINTQYYNPDLTLTILLVCRLTFLYTPILVSLYDKKLSLLRLVGFACKNTEEIIEATEEMELKEFLEERKYQFQGFNIHN